jgi:hypothetical protein
MAFPAGISGSLPGHFGLVSSGGTVATLLWLESAMSRIGEDRTHAPGKRGAPADAAQSRSRRAG